MTIEVLVNGGALEVPDGASVAEVLARFAPSAASGSVAIALMDDVVPASSWGSTFVRRGDRLEVLGAVAGG